MPTPDTVLTAREQELVNLANLAHAGTFTINDLSFGCDYCGDRMPNNGDPDNHATDCVVTQGLIICRLCAEGQ